MNRMPMNKTPMRTLLCLAAMALVASPAHAAPKNQPEPEPLTATGEKLQSEYAAMLDVIITIPASRHFQRATLGKKGSSAPEERI